MKKQYNLTICASTLLADIWHEKRFHGDLVRICYNRDRVEGNLPDDSRNRLEWIGDAEPSVLLAGKMGSTHVESAVR